MTEYYARTDYEYDGGDAYFTVPFDYIKKDYIYVYINDEETENFTWNTSTQIIVNDDITTGDIITIKRITPIDDKLVTYTNTSILDKDTLNLAQDQTFDVVQEVWDDNVIFREEITEEIEEVNTEITNFEDTVNTTVSEFKEEVNTEITNFEDTVNTTVSGFETRLDEAETTIAASVSEVSTAVSTANEALEEVTALEEQITETVENLADKDLSNLTDTGLDKINQSKALETGAVSTDTDVYTAVKGYKYSTFDASKFPSYTSFYPVTISDEGIASGFSNRIYILIDFDEEICLYTSSNYTDTEYKDTFRIKGRATYAESSDTSDEQCVFGYDSAHPLLYVSTSGFTFHIDSDNELTIDEITPYDGMEFDFDCYCGLTGATLTITVDGTEYTASADYSDTISVTWIVTYIGYATDYSNWQGTIDLKYFTIEENDVVVFGGGYETGTDTYTIDDETIEIPYALSKTGSKIVDYDYIESVQAVYDEYGYAPYYTIDEDNETFTLPMGEVYGMIAKNIDTAILNIDTSVDLSDYYTKDETDSAISAAIPTTVSSFTNDAGYLTEDEANTLITTAIGEIENGTY